MTTYVPSSSRINLCTNPSFEQNTLGWSVTGSPTLNNGGTPYVGTQAANTQAVGSGTPVTLSMTALPVSANQLYTVSGYVAQDSANSGTVNINAQIVWLDISGATISTVTGTAVSAPINFVTPQYYRASVTGTAPANAVTATIVLLVANPAASADTYYFDAVLFEQASTLGAYFDGNSGSTSLLSNGWLGAANNSTSIQIAYTSQITSTTYRYLFADLVTNQILAELPLTGVGFTSILNGAGTFSGTILATDATQGYLNIWGATQPARTAVYVERFSDGGTPTLVWGGIVWAREYNSTTQHITLNASEFESYFDRRRIIAITGTTGSQIYKNTDPLLIARTLIQNAQLSTVTANSNIGVVTGTETSSATISKTYFDAELKSILAAVQDLSHASTSGFDFKIKVAYDGAFNPTKTFTIGYPRLGTAYSATNPTAPVLEFPGNVVEYNLLEDGTLASNFIYAVGVGNGQGKLNRYAYDPAQYTAGWPLLEGATNYGDVSNQSLLDNLALGQLNAVKNPPQSLKITYPPYVDPILGSYNLGDDVRVRINDDRAGQIDDYYRIVAISVTPGESNQGERAILTLTQKGAV